MCQSWVEISVLTVILMTCFVGGRSSRTHKPPVCSVLDTAKVNISDNRLSNTCIFSSRWVISFSYQLISIFTIKKKLLITPRTLRPDSTLRYLLFVCVKALAKHRIQIVIDYNNMRIYIKCTDKSVQNVVFLFSPVFLFNYWALIASTLTPFPNRCTWRAVGGGACGICQHRAN